MLLFERLRTALELLQLREARLQDLVTFLQVSLLELDQIRLHLAHVLLDTVRLFVNFVHAQCQVGG